jgi:hypothetical protein
MRSARFCEHRIRFGLFCPEKVNNDRRNVGKINFHASKEVTSKRAENAHALMCQMLHSAEREFGPFMFGKLVEKYRP